MSNTLPTIKTDPRQIIEELYGTTMLGHLGLWSGKTKKGRNKLPPLRFSLIMVEYLKQSLTSGALLILTSCRVSA